MRIVSVKRRYVNKRKEVTTYTLLDNYSQGTIMREGIIHKQETSGAKTKVIFATTNSRQTRLQF